MKGDLITTRRPRPTGSLESPLSGSDRMTPEPKRPKAGVEEDDSADVVFQIGYPNVRCLPPKATLKDLLEKALTDPRSDQSILQAAGILSMEQVLLPAIALHEEAALKQIQAKIQRDHPLYKPTVEAGRRLIRASIRNAIVAVQASRQRRLEDQVVRRQEAVEHQLAERAARLGELVRQRKAEIERQREEAKMAREQRFRNLQRQYPRNKDLWKEIVVLTRSRTQLEKEERLWGEAKKQQEEYRSKRMNQRITAEDENDSAAIANAVRTTEDFGEITILRERTEASVKDIVLASKRIQQGLSLALNILRDSEKARKQLYKEYRENHHFNGYQGVNDPKGLIRFLSQDD